MRPLLGAVLVVAVSQPALAQDEKVLVSVNYGVQLGTERLDESFTIVKHVEDTPVTAALEDQALPFFDIGATVRIAGALGANVALSYISNSDAASVTADIPHPFYFDRPRRISGEAANVRRKEMALHANVAYIGSTPSVAAVIFGGASFFSVDQDFVTDVVFRETFPFDTATFVEARLTRASESKVGFNVGADVTWKLGEHWGVGGLVRFSRASIPFTADGIDFGSVDVGGTQVGGGLRLAF